MAIELDEKIYKLYASSVITKAEESLAEPIFDRLVNSSDQKIASGNLDSKHEDKTVSDCLKVVKRILKNNKLGDLPINPDSLDKQSIALASCSEYGKDILPFLYDIACEETRCRAEEQKLESQPKKSLEGAKNAKTVGDKDNTKERF